MRAVRWNLTSLYLRHRAWDVLPRHLRPSVPQLHVREQKDLLKTIPHHLSFLLLVLLAFFHHGVLHRLNPPPVSFPLCCLWCAGSPGVRPRRDDTSLSPTPCSEVGGQARSDLEAGQREEALGASLVVFIPPDPNVEATLTNYSICYGNSKLAAVSKRV